MSESDDTDVLLLIPPDIFRVRSSSDSDDSSADHAAGGSVRRHRTGVISELVGHMQSLESRVSAIESRDNSLDVSVLNNSLESQPNAALCGVLTACQAHPTRQTLPRTRFTVSQGASLQGGSPVKPRNCLSVPSTPSGCPSQKQANCSRNDARSGCLATTVTSSPTNTNNPACWVAKHDALTSYSDSFVIPSASRGIGFSHAMSTVSTTQDSCSPLRANDRNASTSNLYYRPYSVLRSSVTNLPGDLSTTSQQGSACTRIVQEMELSEVDELLQEMEATELELSKRISSAAGYQYRNEPFQAQSVDATRNQEASGGVRTQHKPETGRDNQRVTSYNRKLDFQSGTGESQTLTDAASAQKRTNDASFPDVSLPYSDAFHSDETDKMISDFRTWEQSMQPSAVKFNTTESGIRNIDFHSSNVPAVSTPGDIRTKESVPDQGVSFGDAGTSGVRVQSSFLAGSTAPVSRIRESVQFLSGTTPAQEPLDLCKTSQHTHDVSIADDRQKSDLGRSIAHVGTNTDLQSRYLVASTKNSFRHATL